MRKILIIANGAWEESADGLLRSLAAQADYRIAADGGWRLARRAGLRVEQVIGDGDSLSLEERTELLKLGIWQRHPADKDQTDLELALAEALAQHADKITCAALLGKRADQALGNLFTLEGPARAGAQIEVVTPEERL
ncbi:MAG TPA: thiamine diphosphokinase, partial [Candidatus Fraserbacteria bacterium]|nr:thiamine diphosphokinase [Candidatus Fraserbacteria bacterium]